MKYENCFGKSYVWVEGLRLVFSVFNFPCSATWGFLTHFFSPLFDWKFQILTFNCCRFVPKNYSEKCKISALKQNNDGMIVRRYLKFDKVVYLKKLKKGKLKSFSFQFISLLRFSIHRKALKYLRIFNLFSKLFEMQKYWESCFEWFPFNAFAGVL